MTGLLQSLFGLLPALNWRRMLSRHGLPLVVAGLLVYEVAIPFRDELLATSRDNREALKALAKAKESDSVMLARLTSLYEARELGRRPEQAAGPSEELTRMQGFPRER